MPLSLPRLQIDADQALAKKIIARTMASIIIARRRFDRQINQSQLLVYSHLRPDAGIAGVLCRSLVPAIVADLALHRNRMENPKALAGLHIESAHIAFVI